MRARSAADYEAVLAPTYGLYFEIAQRPRLQGLGDRGKALVRTVETFLGTRDPAPELRAGPNSPPRHAVHLGGGRLGTAPGELRRPGVRPFTLVLERLGVEADHVLFGHTHRTGPLPGDDPGTWRLASGTALWNTGSWVYEPAYVGSHGSSSAYWPGTLVTLDGSGPPRIRRLLADLPPDAAPP
jgi:hypothetical protein